MPAKYDYDEFKQTVKAMCHSKASSAGYVQQQKDERGRLQEVAVELKIDLVSVNENVEKLKLDYKKHATAILKKQRCSNPTILQHVRKFIGYYAQCQAMDLAFSSPQKNESASEPVEDELELDLDLDLDDE